MIEQLKYKSDTEILALTIFGEARGEYIHNKGGLAALIAVGNVVCNRLRLPDRYGYTIKEICLKKSQFSCWNEQDANLKVILSYNVQHNLIYRYACEVAKNILDHRWPDLTKGSNHYHADWLSPIPGWAKQKKHIIQIGRHLFYNL